MVQVADIEVTVRQARFELQRCSSVLGVDGLAHEPASAAVAGADENRARIACLSALQDARDTGEDHSAVPP